MVGRVLPLLTSRPPTFFKFIRRRRDPDIRTFYAVIPLSTIGKNGFYIFQPLRHILKSLTIFVRQCFRKKKITRKI